MKQKKYGLFDLLKVGMVERNEDQSPDGKLVVLLGKDLDIHVGIKQGARSIQPMIPSVTFCEINAGRGRSPNVRKALLDLIVAIIKDNDENPIKEEK